jgi:hypothetical protein
MGAIAHNESNATSVGLRLGLHNANDHDFPDSISMFSVSE